MKDRFPFQRFMALVARSIKDEELRLKYYDAVIDYGLDWIEPEDPLLRSLIISAQVSIQKDAEVSKARSEKMKGNKNSLKDWTKLWNPVKTDKTEKTESDRQNRKNRNEQTNQITDLIDDNWEILWEIDLGGIYINNILNINLYKIIKYFITNKSLYPQISYQIKKKWLKQYLVEQYKEAEKLEKEIWLDSLKTILNFCIVDDFWKNQILSVKKLNEKNKDKVPYYLVISEKILQRNTVKPNVCSIPTV